jgi:hypothetical protein
MPFHIRPFLTLPLAFWFLIILLVLCSAPAYAEWVLVDKGKNGVTVYVNPDTIRRKVEMVTMWVLFDFNMANTIGDNQSYLSLKEKIEYDCDGERGRILTLTHFSDHMGTGKVVYIDADEHKAKWQPVQPDSFNHTLWKVACGKD